jgi:Type IV secretion-system coupling protein DNA-binding domain
VRNSDLTSFVLGPSTGREFRETVRAWRRVEAAYRRSHLASVSLAALATACVEDALSDGAPLPSAVAESLRSVAEQLLVLEEIGPIQIDWDECRHDPVALVRFRHRIRRRDRWVRRFDERRELFVRLLRRLAGALADSLPLSCIGHEPGAAPFMLSVGALAQDPAALVERIVLAPYEPPPPSGAMSVRLCSVLDANLRRASGLPPSAELREQSRRVLLPTRRPDLQLGELCGTYLSGTPLRRLLEAEVPLALPESVRGEHMALVAGTGHGKTQCIQYLLMHDLEAARLDRRSVVVIDSQGDLINRLKRLRLFAVDEPNGLSDRLILIDPEDVKHPPALNLFDAQLARLESYNAAHRERVFNGLVEAYETLFADLLGAELTNKQSVVFRFLARLMLAIPGATIHTLMDIMRDGRPYRERMVQLEGAAAHFFATEFFEPGFAATKKQILRRLWSVLSTPSFERMFAQHENKLDLFHALQKGSIILVNTAKDLLKSEGSQLFGRFFLKLIEQAALERAIISPAARTPTYVYVDEAQEYFDDSVETLLRQARKFRVAIITACQSLDSLSPRLRSALLTNTSVKCAGGLSAHEARAIAAELGTSAEFLASLRRQPTATEFALWAKNLIPHAIRLPVPLGYLEAQPMMSEEQFTQVIQRNRALYCQALDEAGPSPPIAMNPATYGRREVENSEQPGGLRPHNREASRATVAGHGGPQHRYIQQLIKQLAEERGFRAVIEEAVSGGQVDVGLHQGHLSIACEISITSKVEYEARNVAKCVAAGFARVWSISPDAKRRKAIRVLVQAQLASNQLASVEFLTPDELVGALDALSVPPPQETVVRGYRVTTKRSAIPVTEAKERRAQIARIVSRSLKDSGQ